MLHNKSQKGQQIPANHHIEGQLQVADGKDSEEIRVRAPSHEGKAHLDVHPGLGVLYPLDNESRVQESQEEGINGILPGRVARHYVRNGIIFGAFWDDPNPPEEHKVGGLQGEGGVAGHTRLPTVPGHVVDHVRIEIPVPGQLLVQAGEEGGGVAEEQVIRHGGVLVDDLQPAVVQLLHGVDVLVVQRMDVDSGQAGLENGPKDDTNQAQGPNEHPFRVAGRQVGQVNPHPDHPCVHHDGQCLAEQVLAATVPDSELQVDYPQDQPDQGAPKGAQDEAQPDVVAHGEDGQDGLGNATGFRDIDAQLIVVDGHREVHVLLHQVVLDEESCQADVQAVVYDGTNGAVIASVGASFPEK